MSHSSGTALGRGPGCRPKGRRRPDGTPCSRQLRPPFTRSCPRRSPSFGIFWSVHTKATPSRGLPANHCTPCVGPREPGEPDRPQGPPLRTPPVPGLGSGAPDWPTRAPSGSHAADRRVFGLPSFLASFHRVQTRSFQPTFRPLPFILRRHFSVSTPPMSSGPLPPRGPGLTPS